MSKEPRTIVEACRSFCASTVRWVKRPKTRRANRLTKLISEERKKLQGYGHWHGLKSTFANAYFPSAKSVSAVFVALVVIFAVILSIDGVTVQAPTPVLARLTTIETGIALIFIPITIFVVGLSSRRSSSGVTVAEILLRGVYLFPLTILVMGIVVSFAFITSAGIALFFIATSFLLSAFCIFQIIRLLLDEQSLGRGGRELLQDAVGRSINLALEERIGKNLELRALENLPIDYSPFGLGEEPPETFEVRTAEEGFVQDVLLDSLQQFATELERCANSHGYTYSKKRELEPATGSEGSRVSEGSSKQLEVVTSRNLKKLYADQITNNSNVLVTFPRKLVPDEATRQHLANIARSAFKIKRRVSYSERISRYLGEVKDEAILAIRDRRTYNLESLVEVYVAVAKTFLTEMENAGGGYTFEQAQKEESALFGGGWDEVRWISDHLSEIHRTGCRSGDINVAALVAAGPFHIAYAAIGARDHFLFREFTKFSFRLYKAAQLGADSKMRQFLVERAWTHLRDLGNIGVQFELKRTKAEAEPIKILADFGTVLLLRFLELLRASFDSREFSDFKLFKHAAGKLFEHLVEPQHTRSHRDLLRVSLAQPALSEEDRRRKSEHIDRQELLWNAYNDFTRRRSQMFFALGTHIFKRIVADTNKADISNFLGEINELLPINESELTELYLSFYDRNLQSIWGWEWWGTPEGVSWGDPTEKVSRYYSFLLARLCRAKPREEVAKIPFPKSEVLIGAVSEGGAVRTTLDSFMTDRDKWRDIIPDSWIPNVEALVTAFEGLVTENAREQENLLIASEIKSSVLEGFRDRFKKAFLAKAGVRRVFAECHAYRDESSVFPKVRGELRWGLNMIEDKRFYVDSGLEQDLGKRHGEDLGTSESQFALERLFKLLPESDVEAGETAEGVIRRGIEEILHRGYNPSAIFLGLDVDKQSALESSPSFTPTWKLNPPLRDNPAFIGYFHFEGRKIEAYSAWGGARENCLCVLALPECMQWVQKSPIDDSSESGLVDSPFSIRIADLAKDDKLRAQILSQPPEWLSKQENPDRYLRMRVWLQIFERFELILKQPEAGRKFIIPD